MAERIASGEVWVGISDAEAIAGLRNVDREFDRTMRKIDGKEAEAKVSVNLRELKRELKEAEADLAKWRAKEEAAETRHQERYRRQQRETAEQAVKYLQDRVKQEQNVLGAMQDQNKERSIAADRERAIERAVDRRVKSLEREAVQRAKNEESLRRQGIDEAKINEFITVRQRQYGKLTDQLERIHQKQRRAIKGTETEAKLKLDEKGVLAKMQRIKAELNFYGSHPPVDIKVDTDRRNLTGVSGFIKRKMFDIQQSAGRAVEKLSSISHVRLNLGPFSGTIRTMTVAVGALSPIISSLVLSLGSLVSVAGAGLAGAATVGAGGIVGMGLAFGGLMVATRNTKQEITNARTAINALQKAQEKYGKNSDKAKEKQKELNNTLKNISPLAKQTALGIEKFFSTFDKHSGPTRKNLGLIAKSGFDALNKLTPMWASHTNKLSDILRKNLTKGFDFLSKGEGKNALSQIFANFNRSLPALLRGMGDFGHAFLNFAREGSKYLPELNHGFENMGKHLLQFTQRDDFGAKVKQWVGYGRDLFHWFSEASHVIVDFFAAGTKAGDGFLNDMTGGLQRWDDWLKSGDGKQRLSRMFEEGVKSTEELSHALGPILQSFTEWSTALAPITAGILHVVAGITKIVGMVTHVIALKGAFAALGETIAIAFAVSKLAAFVNMLIKAYETVKLLTTAMAAESLAGGGLFAQAGAGLSALRNRKTLLAAGEDVAGAAEAAKIAESGVAAEKAAGQMALFGEEAATAGESAAAVGTGSAAAAGGLGAIATGAAIALPAVVAVGGAYLIYKHHIDQAAKSVQALTSIDDRMNSAIQAQISAESEAAKTHDRYAAATRGVHRAEKDVGEYRGKDGKKNTESFIDAESRLYTQRQRQAQERSKFIALSKQENKAAQDQVKAQHDLIAQRQEEVKKAREQAEADARTNGTGKAGEKTAANLTKALSNLAAEQNVLRGVQARATTAALNHQRALAGIGPIAQAAAMQVGFFAQQFGKIPNVKKILLSANTSQLSKIASLSKDVNASVGKTATKNILVNAKSADDAIKRLQAIQAFRLDHKNLTVQSPSAGRTLIDLAKIEGFKLNKKEVRALLRGDDDVIRRLSKILGFKLPDKHAHVDAPGASQSAAQINAVKSAIDSLHDKQIRISVNRVINDVKGGKGLPDYSKLGNAQGGPSYKELMPQAKTAQKTSGGKFSRPTFLVGEERKPEYVIATNPAYRKQNVAYWQQAAKALGIPGYAGGTAPNFNPAKTPYSTHGTTKTGKFGFEADLNVAPPPGKPAPTLSKKKKSQLKKAKKVMKLSRANPWGVRVNKLLQQQSDVEREISLREEAQMPEPETFLVQDGTDENGDPKYKLNDTLIKQWSDSFQPIIDARNALIAVIQALSEAIPQALNWSTVRKATADRNAEILLHNIRKNEKRIANKQKAIATERKAKKPNRNKISKLQDDINQLRKRVQSDKQTRGKQVGFSKEAQGDINQLHDEQREAGFDYRDAVIQRDSVVAEQTGITAQAADQLAQTQDKGGSGGGGGGDNQQLSYSDQLAAADQERMNALRTYGSNYDVGQGYGANVDPNSGVIVGLGQTVNPAIMSGPNAANNALSSGGFSGGAAAGGAVSAAFSGGAAAGRAVAAPMMALGAAASDPTAADATGGGTTVNITNNFETQPADPHSWSQGVAFEMAAAV